MSNHVAQKVLGDNSSRKEELLSLNDRLGLIGLIEEGVRLGSSDPPIVADLFSELWDLMDATVSGAKIDRLKPETSTRGFQVFEINAETGENLGRLNMLYLKKPIPCYYLVYVEVAPPFRNKGLGNRILKEFKRFLIQKSAVGILDNIIPKEDPAYDIYLKLDWKPVEEIAELASEAKDGEYMIFVPPALEGRDLKGPVRRLLNHLRRKRPAIDMRDNELMVRRTIEEFKDLYQVLMTYFGEILLSGKDDSLMRFMFSRFVTKLLNFRRRVKQLLGYTGGESLEQILVDPAVRALPIQSYAPKGLATNPSFMAGDRELWIKLPEVLKKRPARIIESLPNYRRPSLVSWMEEKRILSSDTLTIGDLLDLGFDPTRLKEISLDGKDYIFERIQPRLLPVMERKREVLESLAVDMAGARLRSALLKINPILMVIRDRGNGYILWRKLEGIHWDEAVEQTQTQPHLKVINASVGIDRIIQATVCEGIDLLQSKLKDGDESLLDRFTWFVSWDLEKNQPRIAVDVAGSYLQAIWLS